MRACEWQPTGPRVSSALAALRVAERVSATAVPSSTLARPSRRRTKPCGAPRPKRSGQVRRAPRRGQSPGSRPKRPPGQNPELTKPPNGPLKASSRPATPHRSNAPTLQRSNARADGSARRADERAEAAEPRADERSRAVDATQEAPDGRPEQLPSPSPALQAPDQPQESVTAAPQRKRLAMPPTAKASLAPTRP